MTPRILDTITTIDCHYMYANRAAAYLVVDGREAAFVDNNTRFAVPRLLNALGARGMTPEQVRYIIVTHIHLDHSGGTAELCKHCPNAAVIAHPRAKRHLADPSRLVAGATTIYGEKRFAELYGVIEPVPEDNIITMNEGDALTLGERTFTFYDSPGHARHHFSIKDSATNSMFSGDAFGLGYPRLQQGARPFLSYVCSPPPDFDPIAGKETVQKILKTGVDRVFVTHFGEFSALEEGADILCRSLDAYDALTSEAAATDLDGQALRDYCETGALGIINAELRRAGLDPDDEQVRFWATPELFISGIGLAEHARQKRRPMD